MQSVGKWWKYNFAFLIVGLVSCSDTFNYTGFQTELNGSFDYTMTVRNEHSKPVHVEAFSLIDRGSVSLIVSGPRGEAETITVSSSPGSRSTTQTLGKTSGLWSVQIKSDDVHGKIRIKIHTRNGYENFSAEEREYVRSL